MAIEKNISSLIKSQFPRLYVEEGPMFIDFVTAYYDWMSEEGGVLHKSRSMQETLDIDETLDQFISHFQNQYLFGMSENIVTDKRFLIKHILDVYRAKGTIKGYKLLFRLLFNEDIDVYLPSTDILRADDGEWKEPVYIEVNYRPYNKLMVSKKIVGISSGAAALVEAYVSQAINGKIVQIMYLDEILGEFLAGEKVVLESDLEDVGVLFNDLPKIVGSLSGLRNIAGGQGFAVGDNLQVISGKGQEGILRISEVTTGTGSLFFALEDGGSLFTENALRYITRGYDDITPRQGQGASFDIGALTGRVDITYDTDLIIDFDGSAEVGTLASATLQDTLTFETGSFGKIASLVNIDTGNNYVLSANVQVRDVLFSDELPGTVVYTANSDVVTGAGTNFSVFNPGDKIRLISGAIIDDRIVKAVSNTTQIILDDYPLNSATGASHRLGANLIRANFSTLGFPTLMAANNSINGENEVIGASPLAGTGIISKGEVKNSGFGYDVGEFVDLSIMGSVEFINVINGGHGYANNDVIQFSGSSTNPARAVVATNEQGVVTSAVLTFGGSGYSTEPTLNIISGTGSGAILEAVLAEIDNTYRIRGEVIVGGTGKSIGYWTSTKGFIDSDKYLQDDYYYQEYSYEIQSSLTLERYADIMKRIYHLSGTELFGKVVLQDSQGETFNIVNEEIWSE